VTVERIPIVDREQWLELRRHDVTASTIAALFGLHPYTSPLALMVEKLGGAPAIPENSAMRRGRLLEDVVGKATAEERPDLTIAKATCYLRDPELRLGATPDFHTMTADGEPGILQAKTVSPSSFRKFWTDDEPPTWVALQTLTEMMLADASRGLIAVLIVDPWSLDLKLYDVPRNEAAETRLKEAVAQFWDDIANDREPKVDYARDRDLISFIYPRSTPGAEIDLSTDNRIQEILAKRARMMRLMGMAEERKKAIDTEIRAKMRNAETAIVPGWRVKLMNISRKAYTVGAKEFSQLMITKQPNG
jgi:putative phage-type endonuclease